MERLVIGNPILAQYGEAAAFYGPAAVDSSEMVRQAFGLVVVTVSSDWDAP